MTKNKMDTRLSKASKKNKNNNCLIPSPPEIAPPPEVETCDSQGVFSGFLKYEDFTRHPSSSWETIQEYLIGRDIFHKVKTIRAKMILKDARYLRAWFLKCPRHGNQSLTIVLSLYGFGSTCVREHFMRILRYALTPRLCWAADMGNGKWEAILYLKLFTWPMQFVFGGKDTFLESIEKFLDSFSMSIGVMELTSWTDTCTIAAMQRIQDGQYKRGNLWCNRNKSLRLEYELAVLQKRREQESRIVREQMDLDFNGNNMVYLARELHMSHLAQDQLCNALRMLSQHLSSLGGDLYRQSTRLQAIRTVASVLSLTSGLDINEHVASLQTLVGEEIESNQIMLQHASNTHNHVNIVLNESSVNDNARINPMRASQNLSTRPLPPAPVSPEVPNIVFAGGLGGFRLLRREAQYVQPFRPQRQSISNTDSGMGAGPDNPIEVD
jgi:hypothetical protein